MYIYQPAIVYKSGTFTFAAYTNFFLFVNIVLPLLDQVYPIFEGKWTFS